MIRVFIGYDDNETVAYHVLAHSIMRHSSQPVAITPIVKRHMQSFYSRERSSIESTDFSFTRFLVPYLSDYEGWSVFMDCDMLMTADIAELWALRDDKYSVMCVKHDYVARDDVKFLGAVQTKYEKKNWSSVILWNCAHPKNRHLTPGFVMSKDGKFLHRFSWLDDGDVGEIPKEWNWLTTEYPDNYQAKLLHYTLGTPCFKDYKTSPMADLWWGAHGQSQEGIEA